MNADPHEKMDPWSARFAFFWYNDREIFHLEADVPADRIRQYGLVKLSFG